MSGPRTRFRDGGADQLRRVERRAGPGGQGEQRGAGRPGRRLGRARRPARRASAANGCGRSRGGRPGRRGGAGRRALSSAQTARPAPTSHNPWMTSTRIPLVDARPQDRRRRPAARRCGHLAPGPPAGVRRRPGCHRRLDRAARSRVRPRRCSPSVSSRRMSACPTCRAVSSIMCTRSSAATPRRAAAAAPRGRGEPGGDRPGAGAGRLVRVGEPRRRCPPVAEREAAAASSSEVRKTSPGSGASRSGNQFRSTRVRCLTSPASGGRRRHQPAGRVGVGEAAQLCAAPRPGGSRGTRPGRPARRRCGRAPERASGRSSMSAIRGP